MKTTNKIDLYKQINDKIIDLLNSHVASNYSKPWFSPLEPFANNPFSKHTYSLMNQLFLANVYSFKNYPTNRWMTFNQAAELNAKIKKGSKGYPIYYRKFLVKNSSNIDISYQWRNIDKDVKDTMLKNKQVSIHYLLRQYIVFNVADIEGLPEAYYKLPERNELPGAYNPLAESISNNISCEIRHKTEDAAYTYSNAGYVVLPPFNDFKSVDNYYATLFHELGHWTGGKSRLDRNMTGKFGSKEYAFEELIAELTAAYLCAYCGIEKTITNNAAYINSWLKIFENDRTFLIKATSLAEEAANYILLDAKIIDIHKERIDAES